jgi:hypothetical protein
MPHNEAIDPVGPDEREPQEDEEIGRAHPRSDLDDDDDSVEDREHGVSRGPSQLPPREEEEDIAEDDLFDDDLDDDGPDA